MSQAMATSTGSVTQVLVIPVGAVAVVLGYPLSTTLAGPTER